ncbi:MAG: alpha/beta hydrolase, partial [Mycobacterium sp.]
AVLAATGPAVLVGNSLGAATAVRAAARNASVKALVALDDPLSARHFLARMVSRRAVSVGFWSRVGRIPIPPAALRGITRRVAPKMLYGPGARPDPQVIAHWTRTTARASDIATLGRYALQYGHEALGAHRDLRVSCPAVIVHGAKDRIIPVHSSRALHQQIPGSELIVLPLSGHCPQLDNSGEVVRIIADLCGRVDNGERTG